MARAAQLSYLVQIISLSDVFISPLEDLYALLSVLLRSHPNDDNDETDIL